MAVVNSDQRDIELMNKDQKHVMHMLAQAKDYLLVHGMPGTGKTTTIALLVCCSHTTTQAQRDSSNSTTQNRYKHLWHKDSACLSPRTPTTRWTRCFSS